MAHLNSDNSRQDIETIFEGPGTVAQLSPSFGKEERGAPGLWKEVTG
jgi:hypothetical protein